MQNPKYRAVHNRSGCAVNYDGASYREKIFADAGNKALAFKFNRGRSHCVREAGNRYKRACSGAARKLVVNSERGQKHAYRNHCYRRKSACGVLLKIPHNKKLENKLTGGANRPAREKCFCAVYHGIAARHIFFNYFIVFLR